MEIVGSVASGPTSPPAGLGSSLDSSYVFSTDASQIDFNSRVSSLHENVVTVSFSIQNTGRVAGHEVASFTLHLDRTSNCCSKVPQLYLSPPPSANSPPRLLKGFDSVFVPTGATVGVMIQLSRYDFSVWDVVNQRWEIPSGTYGVVVGASSRDVRLQGEIEVQ